MNNHLKKQIKLAFSESSPSKKQAFLMDYTYPKASHFDFFKKQCESIQKRYWLLSISLFFILSGICFFQQLPIDTLWIVSSILPFFLLLSITEMAKSSSYRMEELELSCRYNLPKIMLARLIILSIVNLLMLLLISLCFIQQNNFNIIKIGLCLTTPFILTGYVSLVILNRLHLQETLYICGGTTLVISIANMITMEQLGSLLLEQYSILWGILLTIIIIFSAIEAKTFIQKKEETLWSLS